MKALIANLICSVFYALGAASVPQAPFDPYKVAEFGNVDWESEMLFLDNLNNLLRDEPKSSAHIIVYGGRRGDRRGEMQARIACIKDYMLKRRGICADRLVITMGGYREGSAVELWLVRRGDRAPAATPTVNQKDVKFRRGKIQTWRSRCNI